MAQVGMSHFALLLGVALFEGSGLVFPLRDPFCFTDSARPKALLPSTSANKGEFANWPLRSGIGVEQMEKIWLWNTRG